MKKIIAIIAAVLLAATAGISVCAAETIDEAPGNTEISVCARFAYNTGFNIVPTDENGSGSVSMPDGTEITVSGADRTNGRLVIEEITEKDALAWISRQLKGKADNARAYHIFWLSDDGSSRPTDGVKVSIGTAEGTVDAVFSLKGENVDRLNVGIKNGTVTFTTDGASFYALRKGSETTDTEDKPPQTGDEGNIFLLIVPALALCGIMTCAAAERKRKKTQDR